MRTRRQVLALACAAFAAAVPLLTAHAQVLRNIPADAPRAKLTVTSVNTGTLDGGLISSGTEIRFAPGVRIISQEGACCRPARWSARRSRCATSSTCTSSC